MKLIKFNEHDYCLPMIETLAANLDLKVDYQTFKKAVLTTVQLLTTTHMTIEELRETIDITFYGEYHDQQTDIRRAAFALRSLEYYGGSNEFIILERDGSHWEFVEGSSQYAYETKMTTPINPQRSDYCFNYGMALNNQWRSLLTAGYIAAKIACENNITNITIFFGDEHKNDIEREINVILTSIGRKDLVEKLQWTYHQPSTRPEPSLIIYHPSNGLDALCQQAAFNDFSQSDIALLKILVPEYSKDYQCPIEDLCQKILKTLSRSNDKSLAQIIYEAAESLWENKHSVNKAHPALKR